MTVGGGGCGDGARGLCANNNIMGINIVGRVFVHTGTYVHIILCMYSVTRAAADINLFIVQTDFNGHRREKRRNRERRECERVRGRGSETVRNSRRERPRGGGIKYNIIIAACVL